MIHFVAVTHDSDTERCVMTKDGAMEMAWRMTDIWCAAATRWAELAVYRVSMFEMCQRNAVNVVCEARHV